MKQLIPYYNRLNILAISIFILLVFLQSIWLKNAATLQQKETALQLKQVIPDLTLEINSSRRAYFHKDSLQLSEEDIDEIAKIVQSYLDSNNIDKKTYFSIYKEADTSAFFSNHTDFKNDLLHSEIKSCLSCIISFTKVSKKDGEQLEGETNEAYYERITEVSTFQYYSPVKGLVKDNLFWFSLYQPRSFSNALQSMMFVFITNILLLIVLLYLFHHLLKLLSNYKKLSELKEVFFNNMTHEFKTPLSSIRLASRVLRQHPPAEKAKTYHDLIEKESKTLELQIDKLLELSLLDYNEIELEKELTNIHELIQEIPKRLEPLFLSNQGQIILDLQTQNSTLVIDRHHIYNSLCNLVENSLKYANQPVTIWINTFQKNGVNIITVKDNGQGIPLEFQPYIFERFYRVQKKNQYKTKGFGIGLSYVKTIIEAHKGTISLNQNYKKGCEFVIKLG